jgi:hypothetical protein
LARRRRPSTAASWTAATLRRYRHAVAPAVDLVDQAGPGRVFERWRLGTPPEQGRVYPNPTLILAGRQDASVGYATSWRLLEHYPCATFAVLDRAGPALLHQQPGLITALLGEWLDRVREHHLRGHRAGPPPTTTTSPSAPAPDTPMKSTRACRGSGSARAALSRRCAYDGVARPSQVEAFGVAAAASDGPYTPAIWPIRSSTPSSERSSAICSMNSVPRHRLSSRRGRPTISPRTSCCASATTSLAPGLSCPVRGTAWLNDEEERSRRGTSHGSLRRSDRDRRQASSASDGCASFRASMSSSSTTRTYAEPTVVVLERTGVQWTRPFGATSVARPGSSPGDYVAQVLSFSGRGPRRPFEHGGGNLRPASPDLQASCCSTSSAGRTRHMWR